MIDIVIPSSNEEEFISIAGKLGYKGLLFLYNFDEYMERQKNPKALDANIKINYGILANERNIQKITNKFKNKNVFVAVKSPFNSREIIERSYTNMIFSLEEYGKKDFIHQRGSGLDHITAKLAHDKNIVIGFSLNSIINSKNKGIIIGRMMQNIMLCRKYKVKTIIASFAENPYKLRAPHDIRSLFSLLGMENQSNKNYLSYNL
ncbi:hypothetical protein HYU50_00870 [Candidatus Woesearchaeota archaeon]|nr:hypothetical protein [Candidatus Woesearchaeota archaeon]